MAAGEGYLELRHTALCGIAFRSEHDEALGRPRRLHPIDLTRIRPPVLVPCVGATCDVVESAGARQYDLLVSVAFHARLSGFRLLPHVEVPIQCTFERGITGRPGPELPYRWLAWNDARSMVDELDWSRSTFVEHPMHEAPTPPSPVCFGDRAAFEATKEARPGVSYAPLALAWTDPTLRALDLFVLPGVFAHAVAYVSPPLAERLTKRTLRGLELFARPGAVRL